MFCNKGKNLSNISLYVIWTEIHVNIEFAKHSVFYKQINENKKEINKEMSPAAFLLFYFKG